MGATSLHAPLPTPPTHTQLAHTDVLGAWEAYVQNIKWNVNSKQINSCDRLLRNPAR